MLYFLFGLLTGGALGVAVMCLFQINRASEWDELQMPVSLHPDPEKNTAVGVDNAVKKG